MGAYENPETAIDTQSGQHWRNLQQTITSAGQAVTNTIIAREKEKRDEEKEAKKKEEAKKEKDRSDKLSLLLAGAGKYNDNLSEMKTKLPGVNFQGLNEVANDYAALKASLNDPSSDVFELKQDMNKLDNTIDQVKGIAGYAAATKPDYDAAVAMGLGNQGGLSIANEESDIAQAINIYTPTPTWKVGYNKSQGDPNTFIEFGDNSYKMTDGSIPPPINLATFSSVLKHNGGLVRITPKVDELINNSFNNQALSGVLGMKKDEKGNVLWNGEVINPKYITEEPVDMGSIRGANNAVLGITRYKAKINRTEMAKDMAIKAQINSIADGILAGSTWGATDLYINQLVPAWNAQNPNNKIELPTDKKLLKEMKVDEVQFKEKFTPFYLNHIQDYEVLENGEPKQTVSVISGDDSSGNGNKKNEAERKRQYALQRIAKVNSDKSGKIIGTKGFVKLENGKYTMYKWKNANNTLMEKGNFYSIDADPNTTPEEMYDLMGVYSLPVGKVKPALEVKKRK